MIKLQRAHYVYILINYVIISTLFNFFFNLGIAWVMYDHEHGVALWGMKSVALDTLLTAFLLPFSSSIIINLSTWWTLKRGWIPLLFNKPQVGSISIVLSLPLSLQGVLFGVVGLFLFGVPVIVWILFTKNQFLPYSDFLWFKSICAAIVSLMVSPAMGLLALFGPPTNNDFMISNGPRQSPQADPPIRTRFPARRQEPPAKDISP